VAHITGHVRIAAPAGQVFDTVADTRNEPSFNPAMAGVELLTPLPIGRGTRFRARMGRAGTQMLVELTEFDRPHQLGSRTTSSIMETSGGADLRRRRRRHSHGLELASAPEGLDADARPAVRATRWPHGAQNLDQVEAPARNDLAARST
jgi:hypothetical protein